MRARDGLRMAKPRRAAPKPRLSAEVALLLDVVVARGAVMLRNQNPAGADTPGTRAPNINKITSQERHVFLRNQQRQLFLVGPTSGRRGKNDAQRGRTSKGNVLPIRHFDVKESARRLAPENTSRRILETKTRPYLTQRLVVLKRRFVTELNARRVEHRHVERVLLPVMLFLLAQVNTSAR